MSIRVMSLVWELEGVGATDRLVLLALADHANDDGICYPSIGRLCARTGLKERSTQMVIKRLVKAGLLRVDYNAGRRGANLYQVLLDPRTKCAPAPNAPRTKCTTPPHFTADTPAPNAPEPSRTTIEPYPQPPKGASRKNSRFGVSENVMRLAGAKR